MELGGIFMYRFNNFTQKANDVMNLAVKAAENFGHTYIGSEHILMGLLYQVIIHLHLGMVHIA